MEEARHTVCRVCHAGGDLVVELSDDGEPRKIYGSKKNPAFEGYSCIKGREMPNYWASSDRLLSSVARGPEGNRARIDVERAMDEIASRIEAIVKRYGPSAVACYSGTQSYQNLTANRFLRAFMEALGSPMFFDTTSIDQPGKLTAPDRVGGKGSNIRN